jgi:hypothetical protein
VSGFFLFLGRSRSSAQEDKTGHCRCH